MSEFKFQDILDSTGAVLVRGNADRRVGGVSTDTRTLKSDDMYLSLSGPNFDGNRFAPEAFSRGAGAALLRDGADERLLKQLPADAPVAAHRSPRRALRDLARWHRGRLDIPVIGITGSCGKTSTKNMLVELLRGHYEVVGSPASFNNDIGVPRTLLLADQSTEALVVEIGTNHPGEIASLCQTARPNCGIITNVGASHLEGLGTVEGVAKEKGDLAASLPADGFCVLNADCRFTSIMRTITSASVLTFSVEGKGDLNATNVWFHAGGTTFTLNDKHEVTLPLLGLHTVQNLLAALAACVGLGLALENVLPAVSRLRDGRRRMERIECGDVTVFDDSYNANPESARASVRVLAGLHGHARRVLVLGDMLELGEFAGEMHHEVGQAAAEAGVDLLILIGELSRATAAGALDAGLQAENVMHFPTADDAVDVVPGLIRDGDVVLIKGSRRIGMEAIVEKLTAEAE